MADHQAIRDRAHWFVNDPESYMAYLRSEPGATEAEQARRAAAESAFWLEMGDRGLSAYELPHEAQERLSDIRSGLDDPLKKDRANRRADWFTHFVIEAVDASVREP